MGASNVSKALYLGGISEFNAEGVYIDHGKIPTGTLVAGCLAAPGSRS